MLDISAVAGHKLQREQAHIQVTNAQQHAEQRALIRQWPLQDRCPGRLIGHLQPGYLVADYFWAYMNSGVFPAGWLHDLGLPITVPFQGTVRKDGQDRGVAMQAFEHGILTYDAQNPLDFRVERANVGADYIAMKGGAGPNAGNGGPAGQPAVTPEQAATEVVTAYWEQIGQGQLRGGVWPAVACVPGADAGHHRPRGECPGGERCPVPRRHAVGPGGSND